MNPRENVQWPYLLIIAHLGLFTFHRLAFILWSLTCGHFLNLGLLLAATRFLVFIPLLNLPKIGGREFDQ